MNTEELNRLLPDYILGKLSEDQDKALSEHLEDHPEDLDGWKEIHDFFNEPEVQPNVAMDVKFYDWLDKESEEESTETKVVKLNSKESSKGFNFKRWLPLVAASILLTLGFFLGRQWSSEGTTGNEMLVNQDIETIKEETNQVRTELVMSLAEQPSASKRLKALSEATKLDEATEQVILALFKMLNEDTNINVRLAAVSSLSKYVDNPQVREGLVMSITKQESPLVQIALADLMVTLKEQKSIDSFESLLQKPDLDETAKQRIEESINQII